MRNVREMLEQENPAAVMCCDGGFAPVLRRPDSGWKLYDDYFIGIGDHGNEAGRYDEPWKPTEETGTVPPEGYG